MDRNEFRRLALLEIDSVYRLALSLCRRADQADDLVQETYLRAFRSRADFQLFDHGLRPYLFKILHNAFISRLTSDGRQPKSTAQDDFTVGAAAAAQTAHCDLSTLDWESIDDRLKHAIDDLPLPHRTAFLLCAVEGLRYREIAEVTDVPIGTVMSRLHRARQLLAAQLASLAKERRLGNQNNPVENGSDGLQ